MIIQQAWRFVAPGLYKNEKKVLFPFILLSVFCFISGGLFAYFVVFPPAFRFLSSYSGDGLKVMPAVREYFSLCLRLIIAFGVVFELPIVMVFVAKIGLVDAQKLAAGRKYAILAAFVIAAVVTPTPDIVNQFLMAGPLVVLYEIGLLAVRLFGRRRFIGFEQGS